MSIYHARFGTLLSSKEVADLTGFTLNQLRNQRQRKTGLAYVRQGGTSWYRKDDVDVWIESNGGASWEYVVPDGSASAPLENPAATGEHKEHLDKLAKITTANAFKRWYTWILEEAGLSYTDGYNLALANLKKFHTLRTGEDLEVLFPDTAVKGPTNINMMRTYDPIRYWPSITHAMRACLAHVYGWNVSDEEIMAAPVGEVPPANGGM